MSDTFSFEITTPSTLDDLEDVVLNYWEPGEIDRNVITEPIQGYGLCLKIIGPSTGRNHEVSLIDYPSESSEEANLLASVDLQENYMNYKNAVGTMILNHGNDERTFSKCLIENVSVERDEEITYLLTINMSIRELGG